MSRRQFRLDCVIGNARVGSNMGELTTFRNSKFWAWIVMSTVFIIVRSPGQYSICCCRGRLIWARLIFGIGQTHAKKCRNGTKSLLPGLLLLIFHLLCAFWQDIINNCFQLFADKLSIFSRKFAHSFAINAHFLSHHATYTVQMIGP